MALTEFEFLTVLKQHEAEKIERSRVESGKRCREISRTGSRFQQKYSKDQLLETQKLAETIVPGAFHDFQFTQIEQIKSEVPDAISMYLSIAAECLNKLQQQDPELADQLQKVLNFLTCDVKMKPQTADKLTAENAQMSDYIKKLEKRVLELTDEANHKNMVSNSLQERLEVAQEVATSRLESVQKLAIQIKQLEQNQHQLALKHQTQCDNADDYLKQRDFAVKIQNEQLQVMVDLRSQIENLTQKVKSQQGIIQDNETTIIKTKYRNNTDSEQIALLECKVVEMEGKARLQQREYFQEMQLLKDKIAEQDQDYKQLQEMTARFQSQNMKHEIAAMMAEKAALRRQQSLELDQSLKGKLLVYDSIGKAEQLALQRAQQDRDRENGVDPNAKVVENEDIKNGVKLELQQMFNELKGEVNYQCIRNDNNCKRSQALRYFLDSMTGIFDKHAGRNFIGEWDDMFQLTGENCENDKQSQAGRTKLKPRQEGESEDSELEHKGPLYDEFGNEVDEFGNIIQKARFDEFGNLIDKNGNIIKKLLYDKDGNIVDEFGNIVKKQLYDKYGNLVDEFGNILRKARFDKDGNLIDEFGNIIKKLHYDEDGNLVDEYENIFRKARFDKDGNLIDEFGKIIKKLHYDKDGNLVDEFGNIFRKARFDKDGNLTDANGNIIKTRQQLERERNGNNSDEDCGIRPQLDNGSANRSRSRKESKNQYRATYNSISVGTNTAVSLLNVDLQKLLKGQTLKTGLPKGGGTKVTPMNDDLSNMILKRTGEADQFTTRMSQFTDKQVQVNFCAKSHKIGKEKSQAGIVTMERFDAEGFEDFNEVLARGNIEFLVKLSTKIVKYLADTLKTLKKGTNISGVQQDIRDHLSQIQKLEQDLSIQQRDYFLYLSKSVAIHNQYTQIDFKQVKDSRQTMDDVMVKPTAFSQQIEEKVDMEAYRKHAQELNQRENERENAEIARLETKVTQIKSENQKPQIEENIRSLMKKAEAVQRSTLKHVKEAKINAKTFRITKDNMIVQNKKAGQNLDINLIAQPVHQQQLSSAILGVVQQISHFPIDTGNKQLRQSRVSQEDETHQQLQQAGDINCSQQQKQYLVTKEMVQEAQKLLLIGKPNLTKYQNNQTTQQIITEQISQGKGTAQSSSPAKIELKNMFVAESKVQKMGDLLSTQVILYDTSVKDLIDKRDVIYQMQGNYFISPFAKAIRKRLHKYVKNRNQRYIDHVLVNQYNRKAVLQSTLKKIIHERKNLFASLSIDGKLSEYQSRQNCTCKFSTNMTFNVSNEQIDQSEKQHLVQTKNVVNVQIDQAKPITKKAVDVFQLTQTLNAEMGKFICDKLNVNFAINFCSIILAENDLLVRAKHNIQMLLYDLSQLDIINTELVYMIGARNEVIENQNDLLKQNLQLYAENEEILYINIQSIIYTNLIQVLDYFNIKPTFVELANQQKFLKLPFSVKIQSKRNSQSTAISKLQFMLQYYIDRNRVKDTFNNSGQFLISTSVQKFGFNQFALKNLLQLYVNGLNYVACSSVQELHLYLITNQFPYVYLQFIVWTLGNMGVVKQYLDVRASLDIYMLLFPFQNESQIQKVMISQSNRNMGNVISIWDLVILLVQNFSIQQLRTSHLVLKIFDRYNSNGSMSFEIVNNLFKRYFDIKHVMEKFGFEMATLLNREQLLQIINYIVEKQFSNYNEVTTVETVQKEYLQYLQIYERILVNVQKIDDQNAEHETEALLSAVAVYKTKTSEYLQQRQLGLAQFALNQMRFHLFLESLLLISIQ